MRSDSVPQHLRSHGKVFWQWGKSDHCFKPILKRVCSNCQAWHKLLLAQRRSLQSTVPNRKQGEGNKSGKESRTLVQRQFVNFLCVIVTLCPAFISCCVCTCKLSPLSVHWSSLLSVWLSFDHLTGLICLMLLKSNLIVCMWILHVLSPM